MKICLGSRGTRPRFKPNIPNYSNFRPQERPGSFRKGWLGIITSLRGALTTFMTFIEGITGFWSNFKMMRNWWFHKSRSKRRWKRTWNFTKPKKNLKNLKNPNWNLRKSFTIRHFLLKNPSSAVKFSLQGGRKFFEVHTKISIGTKIKNAQIFRELLGISWKIDNLKFSKMRKFRKICTLLLRKGPIW